MASLPREPLALHGGCSCEAIRYTINIPSLEHHANLPDTAGTRAHPHLRSHDGQKDEGSEGETRPTKFPVVLMDHCQCCRAVSGAIVQCWIIIPLDWVKWDLLPREPTQRKVSDTIIMLVIVTIVHPRCRTTPNWRSGGLSFHPSTWLCVRRSWNQQPGIRFPLSPPPRTPT